MSLCTDAWLVPLLHASLKYSQVVRTAALHWFQDAGREMHALERRGIGTQAAKRRVVDFTDARSLTGGV
jgi:hypothetical protein